MKKRFIVEKLSVYLGILNGTPAFQILHANGFWSKTEMEIIESFIHGKSPELPYTFKKKELNSFYDKTRFLFFSLVGKSSGVHKSTQLHDYYYDFLEQFIFKSLTNPQISLSHQIELIDAYEDVSINANAFSMLYDRFIYDGSRRTNYAYSKKIYDRAILNLDRQKVEFEVQYKYGSIFRHFAAKAELREEVTTEAERNYASVKQYLGKYDSIYIDGFIHLLGLVHAQLIPDYSLGVKRGRKALEYIDVNNYSSHLIAKFILSRYLECLIQQRMFPVVLRIVEDNPVQKGKVEWFRRGILRIWSHIGMKDYNLAVNTFMNMISNQRFRTISQFLQNNYRITKIYIFILILLKDIKTRHRPSNLKLKRMLNVNTEFYIDKGALNISQIISHLLLHIMYRHTDTILDKESAVSRYTKRYLTKGKNYRANCFLKLLFLIPKCAYNPKVISIKAKKLLKKLSSVTAEESGQAMELEIIPFEDLWEMLMDYLGRGDILYPSVKRSTFK